MRQKTQTVIMNAHITSIIISECFLFHLYFLIHILSTQIHTHLLTSLQFIEQTLLANLCDDEKNYRR